MAKNENSENSEIKGEKVKHEALLEDDATDQAVDDIAKHDSDEVLEAEDAKHSAPVKLPWYKKVISEKKIWIPGAVVLVLIILAVVPWTRYKIVGLGLKRTVKVQLFDSQTGKPVSSANVSLDGKTAVTDNKGNVTLKVKVGSATVTFTKKYYTTATEHLLVGLKAGPTHSYKIVATGRQVPITLIDKISNAPIENVKVTAAGTTATTDKDGKVTIVLPANKSTISAAFAVNGYNNATGTIQVTASAVPGNTFSLMPVGKIYFLSNASGKLDVVSTNLDGSNRQTVVAGTGHEDPNNTALLAARDWKYLLLEANRTSAQNNETLYVIDTSTDKMTAISSGSYAYNLAGWSGDTFVYTIDKSSTLKIGTAGQATLVAYNATTGKTITLDTVEGQNNQGGYVQQQFGGIYLMDSQVIYAKNWVGSGFDFEPGSNSPSVVFLYNKGPELDSINVDGTNHRDIKTFIPSSVPNPYGISYLDINTQLASPEALNVDFLDQKAQNGSYNQIDTYYLYSNSTGKLVSDPEIGNSFYSSNYYTYLESPSGNQTFWSEPRDGKNAFFIGDKAGNNAKQILSGSSYVPFGWYTDSYLLVEKGGDEVYIMSTKGGMPIKISDYFKPVQNFAGYGGGYGGL